MSTFSQKLAISMGSAALFTLINLPQTYKLTNSILPLDLYNSNKENYDRFYKHSFSINLYYPFYSNILEASSIKELYNSPKKNIINSIFTSFQIKNSTIVSLSGGVDSMVILHSLSKLKKNVIAIHINYNNRVESKKEAQFLKLYCKFLNVRFELLNIVGYKRETTKRENYEKTTTHIRFNYYSLMIKKYSSNGIILGHHKGDVIENVLSNIFKGRNILDLTVLKKESKKQDSVKTMILSHNISKNKYSVDSKIKLAKTVIYSDEKNANL
jgi:tRNA(Ile)-lysidine synthetase-like protein